jgi:hypothetical protein
VHNNNFNNIKINFNNFCSDDKVKPFIKDNFNVDFDISTSVEFEFQHGWDLFLKYTLQHKYIKSNNKPFDYVVDYLTKYNLLSRTIDKSTGEYNNYIFGTLCHFIGNTIDSFKLHNLVYINASMACSSDDHIKLSPCLHNHLIFCEIKPVLGDDYPCVLRKMKQQIGLTQIFLSKNKHKFSSYTKSFVLFIDQFNSDVTSTEQLIDIFKQSNIIVIFLNQL